MKLLRLGLQNVLFVCSSKTVKGNAQSFNEKRHQEGSVVTCLHASSFWEYMDEGVGILWKHRSSCNSKFRINSWILQSHAIMLIFQNKLFGYQSPPHWICHCPCIAAFQTTERMQNPTLWWQHGKRRGKRRLSYTILTSHAWLWSQWPVLWDLCLHVFNCSPPSTKC